MARLIAAFGFQSYLEVGVAEGHTFFSLRCPRKTAVDPRFRFDLAEARAKEPSSIFHQETSDSFFGERAAGAETFDLIFLDGLHIVDQIIRDFLNASARLSHKGVIVIDDVRPNSYGSSLPDMPQSFALKARLGITDPVWMGNVFKVVPFIDAFCQSFSFAAPALNCLIVWPCPRPAASIRRLSLSEVADFPFELTVMQEDIYNPMPLDGIIARIAAWRG
jgi:hypothetical protein